MNPVKKKYFKSTVWVTVVIGLFLLFWLTVSKYQVYKPDWLRNQWKSMQNIHELEERFLVWQVGMNIISQHPIFGVGVGRFPGVFFQQLKQFVEADTSHAYDATLDFINGANANHVHNDYLQLTAETGILSFAILLWIILLFYYSQIKAIIGSQDVRWRIRHIGLTVATVAILLDAVVSFPFYLPTNGLLFWILLGLTIAHCPFSVDDAEKQRLIPQRTKLWGYGMVILFFIGFMVPTIKVAFASWYLKDGIGLLLMQKIPEAQGYFQLSEKLDPTNSETHAYLGKIYGLESQLEKAVAEYSLAEKYGLGDITIKKELATFYFWRKEYRKAADIYEEIVTLVPNDPEAHKWLGVIYADDLSDKDKAIFHIQKYLPYITSDKERTWFQEKLTELQNSK